jgi:hypothetical protein
MNVKILNLYCCLLYLGLYVFPVYTLFRPHYAHAQLTSSRLTQVSFDQQFSILFAHPTIEDGGIINCVYPTTHCVPFNRAACDRNPGLPVELYVMHGQGAYPSPTGPVPLTQIFAFAWLQNNATICSTRSEPPTGDSNTSNVSIASIPGLVLGKAGQTPQPLPISSALLYPGGVTGLSIPNDFGPNAKLTTYDIMHAFPGVCPDENGQGSGIPLTPFKICFGLNTSGNNGINLYGANDPSGFGMATGGDSVGYFQFPVDTLPPTPPTISNAKGLFSRIETQLDYDNSFQEISGVKLSWSNNANALNSNDCASWANDPSINSILVAVSQTTQNSILSVPAENGQTYALCAQTVDLMGNLSAFSSPAQAIPQFECDLFSCYRDPLAVGYCGTGWFPWGLLLLISITALRNASRSPQTLILALILSSCFALPSQAKIQSRTPDVDQDMRSYRWHAKSYNNESQPFENWPSNSTTDNNSDAWMTSDTEKAIMFWPIRWDIELRLGPYRPALLTTSTGKTLTKTIFNSKSYFRQSPLMTGVQAGGFLWHKFGALGTYGSLHYWQQSASSRACYNAQSNNEVCNSLDDILTRSQPGTDRQTLSVLPLTLGAIYRFDELRHRQIPLVFTGRVGLTYAFWWSTLGKSPSRLINGKKAEGGIFGLETAVQVAVALNAYTWHKKNSTVKVQDNYGRQQNARDAYFFVEAIRRDIQFSLQSTNTPKLSLSDPINWVLGISFAFH